MLDEEFIGKYTFKNNKSTVIYINHKDDYSLLHSILYLTDKEYIDPFKNKQAIITKYISKIIEEYITVKDEYILAWFEKHRGVTFNIVTSIEMSSAGYNILHKHKIYNPIYNL
jgi:hypothetical protein